MRSFLKQSFCMLITVCLAINIASAQSIAELKQRAARGDAGAMRQLALDYGKGDGVAKDQNQWLHWNQLAAEHGNVDAMADVGSWYLVGEYLPQNFSRAFYWLHRAAEDGSPLAMANLGTMYDMGEGLPANHSEAYFWLDLATANPGPSANADDLRKERDEAASHLSGAALASIQERAAKWLDAHPRAAGK